MLKFSYHMYNLDKGIVKPEQISTNYALFLLIFR